MATIKEIKSWFMPFYKGITQSLIERREELSFNAHYEKFKGEHPVRMNERIIDTHINYLYSFFNWLNIEWKHSKENGNIRFVTYQQLIYDWDIEFGANDWAPDMKGFRPLDMFLESAGCVGFFIGREDKQGLYLYKFDGETIPLYIHFEGYLKLLEHTKGYNWWQNALVQLHTGIPQPNVSKFREVMPTIFPNFNWDHFAQLYESLRIDR